MRGGNRRTGADPGRKAQAYEDFFGQKPFTGETGAKEKIKLNCAAELDCLNVSGAVTVYTVTAPVFVAVNSTLQYKNSIAVNRKVFAAL